MSGYVVCVYVVTSTLAAVIITLCGFQLLMLSKDVRKRRPPTTLAELSHRRLSSMQLDEHGDRDALSFSVQRTQRSRANSQKLNNVRHLDSPSANAPLSPAAAGDSKLASVQRIEARSAALRSDDKAGKSHKAKTLTPTGAPATKHQRAPASAETSDPSTSQEAVGGSMQRERAESAQPAVKMPREPAGAVISSQSIPTKNTAKTKAASQTTKSDGDQVPTDGLPAFDGLEPLEIPASPPKESKPIGTGQTDDILSIFTEMGDADSGLLEMTEDIDQIDGGGLPNAAQKTSPKARK